MMRFNLRAIFIATTIAAFFIAALVNPWSFITGVVVWTILGSFAFAGAMCFTKHRSPFLVGYVLAAVVYMTLIGGGIVPTDRFLMRFEPNTDDQQLRFIYYGRMMLSYYISSFVIACVSGWIVSRAISRRSNS